MNRSSGFTFQTASVSDQGTHPANQDACGYRILPSGVGCWVLADGLGGHRGGEVASRLAVDAALAEFSRGLDRGAPHAASETVGRVLEASNEAVKVRQGEDAHLESMRCTLVVLVADGRQAIWGHVGDSRIYHLRSGRIHAQSVDHSVPQMLVAAGELRQDEIRHHEDRSRLLRSLGQPGPLKASVTDEPCRLQAGDAFLLCSDGFWEGVLESEMEQAFQADPESWLGKMSRHIEARRGESWDDTTAVAVIVRP